MSARTAAPDEPSLQLLVESFVAIAGERHADVVLEQALDLAHLPVPADLAVAATVEGGTVDSVVKRGLLQDATTRGHPLLGPDLLGAVVAGRRTVRLDRVDRGGVGAFLGVPIVLGERLLGAIALGRAPGRPAFEHQDELFCEALARHTAMALNAARLGDDRERAEAILAPDDAVVDLTPRGVSRLGVIEGALAAAREQLGMDVSLVSEFTGGRQVFRVIEGDGGSFRLAVGGSTELAETYCLRMVTGALPEAVPDTRADPRVCDLPATRADAIGAYIGVPVRFSDGRLFGTLCCLSHSARALDDHDVRLLKAVARIVAAQLEDDDAWAGNRRRVLERVGGLLVPGGIRPAFQPIVELGSGRVIGVEALARFEAEPPQPTESWFADADEVGLGHQVQAAALRAALEALRHLDPPTFLSVNVSPGFVVSGSLAGTFDGVALDRVVLELTEHVRVDDYGALSAALAPLRAAGLRVAVDDAGAGFASLRHILRLSPEFIKLDVSLTRGVDVDPVRAALAASLVAFAAKVGATLIAEGVETTEEAAALRDLGVTHAQGFHLGPPRPLAA